MKPIPTEYNGTEYRSRLEARWALFLDEVGCFANYEPFAIEHNNLSYTPDFYVMPHHFMSDGPYLIEIKPIQPNERYLKYLTDVHCPGKSDILVCVGQPSFDQPNGYHISTIYSKEGNKTLISKGFCLIQCPECKRYTVNGHEDAKKGYGFLSCGSYHVTSKDLNVAELLSHSHRFDL